MPKVFVPQIPTRFDSDKGKMVPKFDTLNDASEFGELVILLDRNDDVWNPDATLAKLKRALRGFNDEDFILPMGSHHFMMWTALIASQNVDVLQSLQWHAKEKRYRVIRSRVADL